MLEKGGSIDMDGMESGYNNDGFSSGGGVNLLMMLWGNALQSSLDVNGMGR